MKKFFTMLTVVCLSLVMGLACFGCGEGGSKSTLTIWGAQEDQTMLRTMVDAYKLLNPDKFEGVTIAFGSVGENDAAGQVLRDLDAAADIFAFSNDQIVNLVNQKALYNLTPSSYTADVKARNSAASVQDCTVDSKMYAYPSTAESYYMYYNKSVYPNAADIKTLEAMSAKASAAGMDTFGINLGDGYFAPVFWHGMGCKLYGDDGKNDALCDYDSANGVKAATYMMGLNALGVKSYDQPTGIAALKAQSGQQKRLSAFVMGAWAAEPIKEALGADFAVAPLPKFVVGGTEYQMTPYVGHKVYGVKSTTKYSELAVGLANWFTNEANQLIRFTNRKFFPTNKVLADNEAILADPLIQVEVASIEMARPKPCISSFDHWNTIAAYASDLYNGVITATNVQAKMTELVGKLVTPAA